MKVRPIANELESPLDLEPTQKFEISTKDALKSKIALYLLKDKGRKDDLIRKFEEEQLKEHE